MRPFRLRIGLSDVIREEYVLSFFPHPDHNHLHRSYFNPATSSYGKILRSRDVPRNDLGVMEVDTGNAQYIRCTKHLCISACDVVMA